MALLFVSAHRHSRPLVVGLIILTLGLGGCGWFSPLERPTDPSPEAPTAPDPSPDPPAVEAPRPAPTEPEAPLPDNLVQQWEPLSNVLLTFGPMTVTPDQVQWGSGQTSDYTVISADDGYVLALTDIPNFYDTPNPYIRLIPKTSEMGETTAVEVAFYESEASLKAGEYIMYGSYFLN